MSTSVKAIINKDLLRWARDNAGDDIASAAKAADVKEDQVSAWEDGSDYPTVAQLRKLANRFKRPLAFFYLPAVPTEKRDIRDYRQLPGADLYSTSRHLRYAIRRAFDRREVAIELSQMLGEEYPEIPVRLHLRDDPEQKAQEIRAALGISDTAIFALNDQYKALNYWKAAVERYGILVFQADRIDESEMRGFSIGVSPFPVIVLNAKDAPTARVFTLAHELTHLLLHDSGLCDPWPVSDTTTPEQRTVEAYCNKVAAGILVPSDTLLAEDAVRKKGRQGRWTLPDLRGLAQKYSVSPQVVLFRLSGLNRVGQQSLDDALAQLAEERKIPQDMRRSAPVPRPRLALSRSGRLFTRLVLDTYYNDQITLSEVSEFLDVRTKHLPEIERVMQTGLDQEIEAVI